MMKDMEAKKPTPSRAVPSPRTMYARPGALVLTAIIIVIGALVALTFFLPQGERVNAKGYQVVYLSSGQAYFGKLKNTTGDYLVLEQAYAPSDQTPAQDNAERQTALVKVSEQVYGPEDSLSIKADQVVFWQNLRDDSKVVEAINNAN